LLNLDAWSRVDLSPPGRSVLRNTWVHPQCGCTHCRVLRHFCDVVGL